MRRAVLRAMGALLLALLPCATALAAGRTDGAPVVIGTKEFTESLVLGEIAAHAARDNGVRVELKRDLGGTRILWTALTRGDIDAYPEYTGTISQELLHDVPANASIEELRAKLKPLGIGISAPLGFSDNYALGMRASQAARLGIRDISDLKSHPDLRFAFSNEFMHRDDGWPGLRRAYGLTQGARGMEHALAYRALAARKIDVTDLYSTDAEIAQYHLYVLQDNLHYFPTYQAVFLYRLEVARRAPRFIATLAAIAGTIDAHQMREMNKAVQIHHRNAATVAAAFLGATGHTPAGTGFWHQLGRYTLQHLALVGISLAAAILVAVPLGIFAARWRRLGQLVLGLTGVLQTVPSLALFVFMIPLFGIGAAPAIAALFLYSLLPIVRNTHAGLTGIRPALLESAAALGLPARVRLWRIELPLALRPILAGIKIAAVINVGTATLGALIGAGGYGQPILTGIRLDSVPLIMEGAVPAALLALAMQGLFEIIERLLTPRGLRLRARE